jgi:flagellar motility protein MotE (MotC chaperone)
MAIPKAYQTNDRSEKKHKNSRAQMSDRVAGEQMSNAQNNVAVSSSTPINLSKKTKYVWLALVYILIVSILKCSSAVSKWESGDYKMSLFGVTLSVGKKATAAAPAAAPAETQSAAKPADMPDESQLKKDKTPPEEKQEAAAGGTISAKDSNHPKETTLKTDTTGFDVLSTSSPKEVELLLKLAAKRQDMEKREAQVKERELALDVAMDVAMKQQKEKAEELIKIKDTLEGLLKKTDKTAHEQTMNLIKVYEGMKPKSAAEIFNKLDPVVLKDIIPMMSQKKVSVILDQMQPGKAKDLSLLLLGDKNPFAAQPKKKGA